MREKLIDKNKVNEEHESNFQTGRVNVKERYLHRTGIRGRKRYIFYCIIFLLGLICIINLIVSTVCIHILKLNVYTVMSLRKGQLEQVGICGFCRVEQMRIIHSPCMGHQSTPLQPKQALILLILV